MHVRNGMGTAESIEAVGPARSMPWAMVRSAFPYILRNLHPQLLFGRLWRVDVGREEGLHRVLYCIQAFVFVDSGRRCHGRASDR